MPTAPHLHPNVFLGRENLPAGGALIIPNLLTGLDLQHLENVLTGRQYVFLIEENAVHASDISARLELGQHGPIIIPADPTVLGDARVRVQEEVGRGTLVVYVPQSVTTRPAPLTSIFGEVLEPLFYLGVPVLPLYVQHHRDLVFGIETQPPANDAVYAFAEVIPAESATVATFQEALLLVGEKVFSANPILERSLPYVLLQGLKKHAAKGKLVDGKDGQEWNYGKVLAAAIVLSKHVKEVTTKSRVGILLPPGFGGMVANLAVLFAGKVPVNLNFTASRGAIESAMRQADLDHYLTADLFVRKLQSFPWPPNRQLTFIERLLPSKKAAIVKWLLLSKILPASVLAGMLGISKNGGDEEAVLLFTSGSSGDPKGVVLTHRNLLANVLQFGSRLGLHSGDGILGCLPLFHSFGCTVTLWFPVISGVNLITYPTPLETKKLAELIHQYGISLFISTPTFLRGYLRGVNPELFASLKLVVTGAEKLPKSLAEAFEARFGKPVCEGYGLTETSPASNVNLPDLAGDLVFPSRRFGSVGQLLPGMAIRITDVETDEPRSLHDSGMIWFKGANVFTGYLNNQKKTDEVIKDGWFRTGDIGRLDADGFLYVEGRLSRFSKIGGEMVPHETVEDTLIKALALDDDANRRIAVVGVPDEDKGEALVLLTSMPGGSVHQEILDLRYKLLERGMPPLWIPKKMVRVQEIPILSSGKLDIKECERVAKANS